MTLFEECKELLKTDFNVVEGDDLSAIMDIFHQYPWHSGNLRWSEMDFSDYELSHDMFNGGGLGNETVFVIADDANVPSLYTILCKCLFSEVTAQAVTELDDKTAHCHAPVPQRHRPFL
ncbi:CDI toxin immunity protein [Citrobacter sp. MGH100]|uniref:CDI toxin immunity protein n=1 Tax=Citrobacter sp. MGH100 TaxID=1686377 RepID=UPI0006585CAE|nr:hypothetical protein SK32_01277 [Citrobacter sp. MGH100]